MIYGFFHVNERGQPATKIQYLELLNGFERYICGPDEQSYDPSDLKFIQKVDEWQRSGKPEWLRKSQKLITEAYIAGERRYLSTKASLGNAKIWAAAFRKRLNQIPEEKSHLPIPWAVSEIGWTVSPIKRRHQHESHSSSNNLMNMFEALGAITIKGTLLSPETFSMKW